MCNGYSRFFFSLLYTYASMFITRIYSFLLSKSANKHLPWIPLMTLSYNFFPFFQFHFNRSISFPCSFFLLYLIVVFLKYPLLITNILACQIYTYWNICLYFSDVFKTNKLVNSFQDILLNIFEPLFEVTNDPKSHPELHAFLQHVSDGYFLEHYWF